MRAGAGRAAAPRPFPGVPWRAGANPLARRAPPARPTWSNTTTSLYSASCNSGRPRSSLGAAENGSLPAAGRSTRCKVRARCGAPRLHTGQGVLRRVRCSAAAGLLQAAAQQRCVPRALRSACVCAAHARTRVHVAHSVVAGVAHEAAREHGGHAIELRRPPRAADALGHLHGVRLVRGAARARLVVHDHHAPLRGHHLQRRHGAHKAVPALLVAVDHGLKQEGGRGDVVALGACACVRPCVCTRVCAGPRMLARVPQGRTPPSPARGRP